MNPRIFGIVLLAINLIFVALYGSVVYFYIPSIEGKLYTVLALLWMFNAGLAAGTYVIRRLWDD